MPGNFPSESFLDQYNPDFAFAYGSGVFQQASYKQDANPMVDLILGAKDTQQWHEGNVSKNSSDYSVLGRLFHNKLQNTGAHIYYHPYVNFQGREIKYGITSIDTIKKDLEEWTYLYVAGRMHKPVQYLKQSTELGVAIQKNLENALRVALCLLPESFTQEQLFQTISGLSYIGDSRMKHGENPDKAKNIVAKNMDGFEELYQGVLQDYQGIHSNLDSNTFSQGFDRDILLDIREKLPLNLRNKTWKSVDPHIGPFREEIKKGISMIVNGPSKVQAIKGIATSGVRKSFKYALAKVSKARNSKK